MKIKSWLKDWRRRNFRYIFYSIPILLFILQYVLGISDNDNIEEHTGTIEKVAEIRQGSIKDGFSRYYLLFTLQGDDKLYGQYYEYAMAFNYIGVFNKIHIEPGDKLTYYIDKNENEKYYSSQKFIIVLNKFYDRIRGRTYNDENMNIVKTTGIVLNDHTEINYKDRKYLTFPIMILRFVIYLWLIFIILLKIG